MIMAHVCDQKNSRNSKCGSNQPAELVISGTAHSF